MIPATPRRRRVLIGTIAGGRIGCLRSSATCAPRACLRRCRQPIIRHVHLGQADLHLKSTSGRVTPDGTTSICRRLGDMAEHLARGIVTRQNPMMTVIPTSRDCGWEPAPSGKRSPLLRAHRITNRTARGSPLSLVQSSTRPPHICDELSVSGGEASRIRRRMACNPTLFREEERLRHTIATVDGDRIAGRPGMGHHLLLAAQAGQLGKAEIGRAAFDEMQVRPRSSIRPTQQSQRPFNLIQEQVDDLFHALWANLIA